MTAARLLTPTGVGAVAVLACDAWPAALTLATTDGRERGWPAPGRVVRGRLVAGGRVIDDVLAVGRGRGGELHLHGSPGVVAAVREHLGGLASCASPAPRSWRAARVWLANLDGPAAALVAEARGVLEGAPAAPDLASRLAAAGARRALGRHLADPPRVDLVGRPNAGKSTLFNALLGYERALTSPRAGTTVDTVEALWLLRGVPVCLRDRAGAFDTPRRAGAELLLHLVPADPSAHARERDSQPPPTPEVGVLRVRSQIDRDPGVRGPGPAVSALTGEGLEGLVTALAAALELPEPGPDDLLTPLVREDAEILRRAAELLDERLRR